MLMEVLVQDEQAKLGDYDEFHEYSLHTYIFAHNQEHNTKLADLDTKSRK